MRRIPAIAILTCSVLFCVEAIAQPVAVTKTNPLPVYMHYMPWFETPATLGGDNWGYHWTFNNQNPNIIDSDGQRQIASHYYPLIGPYASSDPKVLEYHMLLMKLSGVDGIMIDWYGVQGRNADIGSLLTNSNAAIAKVDDFGLKFGVVMEDRYATVSDSDLTPDISKSMANVGYLRDNYFNNPSYIRQSDANQPLLQVFGPVTFKSQSEWTQILSQAGEPVDFNTLWNQSPDAGTNADGEYAWVYQNAGTDNHLTLQSSFLQSRAATLGTVGGVAYPGFNDFYEEGGTGTVIGFEIPHNDGQTLADLLALDKLNIANMDYLQLATFNDFSEGTMFEPTLETGFSYLHQVQQFTGVPYGIAELELVHQLYLARVKYTDDPAAQLLLDQVSANLAALKIDDARALLGTVPEPSTFALAGFGLLGLGRYAQRRGVGRLPGSAE